MNPFICAGDLSRRLSRNHTRRALEQVMVGFVDCAYWVLVRGAGSGVLGLDIEIELASRWRSMGG